MTIQRRNDSLCLVNDEAIKGLLSAVVEVDESLRRLSDEVRRADYPTNKMYLLSVAKEGGKFILDDEEKKVRKWTKDSPLAPASISRLVREAKEAVPETLLSLIERTCANISLRLRDYPANNWKDYLSYDDKDSSLCLSPKFTEDNESLLSREITEAELVDVEDLLEMIPRLQDLYDKGYSLLDSIYYNTQRSPYLVQGCISRYLGERNKPEERKALSQEDLLLQMMTTKKDTSKFMEA